MNEKCKDFTGKPYSHDWFAYKYDENIRVTYFYCRLCKVKGTKNKPSGSVTVEEDYWNLKKEEE